MSAPCKPVQIISFSSTVYPHLLVKPLIFLPFIGGIGTTIFSVSGLLMAPGAYVILISRRRADAESSPVNPEP